MNIMNEYKTLVENKLKEVTIRLKYEELFEFMFKINYYHKNY